MRVCVTGAGGYLGRGIVASLIDRGCDVVATGWDLGAVDDRAKKIEGDVFAVDDPYASFGEPDVLLHLAWQDGFNHNAPSHMANLPLHCDFVEKVCKSQISELCVMGSMHEVGYHEGPVLADTPCFPMSRYGIAKNALRDFCKLVAGETGTRMKWLRGFYIVDADTAGCSIFSKIAQAAKDGKKAFPFTSGKNKYDFLDYPDFCARVADAIAQRQVFGIINVCSGKPMALGERVLKFIEEEGFDLELEYGVFPDRPYDSPAIWGDSSIIDQIATSGALGKSLGGER